MAVTPDYREWQLIHCGKKRKVNQRSTIRRNARDIRSHKTYGHQNKERENEADDRERTLTI